MTDHNRTPEQRARAAIDAKLEQAGWSVQSMGKIDFGAGTGVAVREYPTDVGPADYVLFIDSRAVGVIEAKREEWGHKITAVEEQSGAYAAATLKWVNNSEPLPFVYESTGVVTRFTNRHDPVPRSREVFSFPRPETMQEWAAQPEPLRKRLHRLPRLDPAGLRDCQISAIENLEASFKDDHPRALIQMATGSGKTYTAITAVYRLLKHADAKRILFLVDTRNLGEQAQQEFMAYVPSDDNRKFVELYNVQRLTSSFVAGDSQVCISTIQRMYSILKGEEMDTAAEEINPAELVQPRESPPVVYNPTLPPEFFDFIIIDECHRSIYDLWRQVLEYFDAYLIGLTATPGNRTYGFFRKNVVSEYSHEQAVADGVNVGNEVYVVETEKTQHGGQIRAGSVERRERLTRRKRWEIQDEDRAYSAKELDRSVVNPDQIRTVIRTLRDKLPEIFPGRNEIPKTLIFAKTDSHADDIIQTVREEFGAGNEFCRKITYKVDGDPKSLLTQFRNDYYPRIAVTVDMIATGTDVKPLECLVFMRDVRSRNYFEQMKGRGTRTLDHDDLRKVTPSAATAKTHYVIVDAVGVTKSVKTDSGPLISKPGVPLKDLAMGVMMGARDEETISSLAGRLARLNRQLDDAERRRIEQQAGGVELTDIVGNLLAAIDPDRIDAKARELDPPVGDDEPAPAAVDQARDLLAANAAGVFTGELIDLIDSIRRDKEQTIDHDSLDTVLHAEWEGDAQENAQALAQDFQEYLEANRDQIEALAIFYAQPHRRREVTYAMIRAVLDKLKGDKPLLAPLRVWKAYALLDDYRGQRPDKELAALVALIRRVCGIDKTLSPYAETVRRNFQSWIMTRHSGSGEKFNDQQMAWLRMIRDHVATSFHLDRDDLEMSPFDSQGGLGRMHQLFGSRMDTVINELNDALAS